MSWISVGLGAAGAVTSYLGSKNAGKDGQNATNQAIAAQQQQYQQIRADNLPALDARNNALMMMQQKAGQYGMAPTADQVMAQPGYQFGLQQGNANVQNGAAAAGGLYSGAAGKALSRYGTDYATTKYGQAFDQMQTAQNNDFGRYATIGQIGQAGASTIAGAGQNMANQNSGALTNNGAYQGAADIAGSNQIAGGLNQLGSWAHSTGGQQAIGGVGNTVGGWFSSPNTNTSYGYQNGSDIGWNPSKYADGGPVRQEPVIGSRTPLPQGGTGGGLSRNALLQILALQAQQPQPPQQQIPAANFLMNPGALLQQRMQQAGAYAMGGPIHGPGGPKDDQIPAMLSDGEHVIDTASVNAIGGGSNDKGQNRLNALRKAVKGGK